MGKILKHAVLGQVDQELFVDASAGRVLVGECFETWLARGGGGGLGEATKDAGNVVASLGSGNALPDEPGIDGVGKSEVGRDGCGGCAEGFEFILAFDLDGDAELAEKFCYQRIWAMGKDAS